MTDTKTRLLDAAETLFAERGIAETSLRDITTHAEANLAAVNYHFGGKDGLLEALFARRLGPVNAERLALLDALEAAAGGAPLEIEQILYANLAPPFRRIDELGDSGQAFMRVVARINADPSSSIHQTFLRHFDEIRRRFLAALERALPELSSTEVERRFHFGIAAMMHTFCWGKHVECLCTHPAEPSERVLSSLIEYAAGGLRAPRGTVDINALLAIEAELTGVVA